MNFSPRSRRAFHGSGPVSFLSFVLLPILAFTLGWVVSDTRWKNKPTNTAQLVDRDATVVAQSKIDSVDISLLRDAIEIVREKFVDPDTIDPEAMKYGIVRGLVWSLEDPYSEFMTPQESADFEHELDGDLEGIGAELTVRQGVVVVVSPLRDSPAEQAGLLPEDIIMEVDGEEASGDRFLNVINRIRGEKGTQVTLRIFRPSLGEEKEIVITRDKIRIETVELSWNEDIAILEVSQFGTNTEKEFENALNEVIASTPRGIILDLRFNSGGYLDTAVQMVSAFQKTGKVVIQKGRPPETSSLFVTGNVKTDLPLVILQNRGSASASEIVAGALQDHGRATIVGTQSFGKGTVQELIPMKEGALRLTIAKWLTPDGRDIGKKGIEPDLEIERTPEDYEADSDPQMEAGLRFLRGETLESIRESLQNIENDQPVAEAEGEEEGE